MNIGLDFDETFTADPDLWLAFVKQAEDRGHKVFIVSCRMRTPENLEIVREFTGFPLSRIILTSMAPKRWYCDEKYGLEIDVWIDDMPESVKEGR